MPKRPHIVIFNPDQWRGDTLAHLGHPAVHTPTLDRLVATDAVSCRWAFCQNTVCTPSRCSFMTGWYPHTRGHRTMFHMLQPDEPCLLKTLKDNGYYVWWGGKNDLVPGQGSFDAYCSHHQNQQDDPPRLPLRPNLHWWQDWRGPPDGDNYYSFFGGRLDDQGQGCYFDHDWYHVEGAIDVVRRYRGEAPLCLYVPLGYPHPPYAVEEPFFSAVDRARLPPRLRAPPGWRGKPALLPAIASRQRLEGWTEDRWTELRATYYGMCARVDHQLGLLVDALKAAGIYDDTALFFFSDHGDFTGDYGLVEKSQNTFEDCLARVPFVIKPPAGVPVRPRVSEALVELVDFPATVYDLAGLEPGYDQFGRSLRPLLAGDTDTHRDAVFCEGGRRPGERQCMERDSVLHQVPTGLYWPRVGLQSDDSTGAHLTGVMCRTRDYKYVRRLGESDELYDLRRDPGELDNRIADPALASVRAELRDRMLTFFLDTGDVVPRVTDKR